MRHKTIVALSMVAAFSWAGCIVAPVRLNTRMAGTNGKLPKGQFNFVKPGVDRQQMLERLQPISTGVESDRFFYGRYTRSGWAIIAAVAGGYDFAAGGSRLWHGRNLIVDYDDEGRVTASHNYSDGALASELRKRAGLAAAPDCAAEQSIPIAATHFWAPNQNVSLTLREPLVILPARRGHPGPEHILLNDLRLTTGGTAPRSDPDLSIGVSLRSARDKGLHFNLRTSAKDLFALVQYAELCRNSRAAASARPEERR